MSAGLYKPSPRPRFPLFVVAALALIASCARIDRPAPMLIYLLIGQSNMAGRGVIEMEDRVPHPRVFVLNQDLAWEPGIDPLHYDKPVAGVGLGSTFGRVVADRVPSARIGLVPAAMGGSSIDDWMPGKPLYLEAVRRARAALKDGVLAGILWHQGEADSTEEKAAAYAEKFRRMSASFREELATNVVPIIVGETCRERPGAATINPVLAGLADSVPFCAFVSSEGLVHRGDRTHFDSASLRELGRRYAAAWFRVASDRFQSASDAPAANAQPSPESKRGEESG